MYACVLIPRELSLVLTLHPNPMHMLEMSATVWSNSHLSPGAIFYPDEGDVRLDRIDSRMVISDEDIRRYYGCYDTIMNVNGQEVRHCNWVRFVKTTTNPDDANIISSKVRGQSFYQVIRPIKPNEEIIVLFHLITEKFDTRHSSQFLSYSPNVCSPLSSSDLQNSLLIRQARNVKSGLITSTPLSTRTLHRDTLNDDQSAQRRFIKLGSSPSSSSFTSAHPETPINYRCQRSSQRESSFTPSLYTLSSSRETSSSDNHSWIATHDASFDKGLQRENIEDAGKTADKEYNNDQGIKRKCQTPETSNDQHKETEVDVVNLTNPDNDVGSDESDDFEEFGSDNGQSQDEATSKRSVDMSSEEYGDKKQINTPSTASFLQPPNPERSPTPASHEDSSEILSPDFKKRRLESPKASPKPNLDLKAESIPSKETKISNSETEETRSLHDDDQSQTTATEDSIPYSNDVSLERSSSNFEDVKYSGKDTMSSNEEWPFSFQLSRSAMPLDLQSTETLDHPQLKRNRERTWWPCDVCNKKFDRPSLLKRHTRTHTGEKPHACDVCGKAFSTSSSLNTHRRIHSGEKPHQCKTCGKRFTASSNLYYHRMTHNKEKPHKCDLCSKSFPTPGDLRSHMYIHNGSWPFKCDVCNRGFSKQTNLKNHMLLHSGDKPHECAICEKKFALLCNLRTHMKTHENSDSSDCTECLKCGIAIETSDIHENICKRCSQAPRRFTPKPSSPSLSSSLRQQRHTDFSISKLTSSDVKSKVIKSERQYTLLVPPSMISGDAKSEQPPPVITSSASINSHHHHHLQMPTMYRQFFAPASDQHKWLIQSQPQQFLAGRMTHPPSFYGPIKNEDGQTPPTSNMKLDSGNHVHSGAPTFISPEMMSLRGGSVFPSVSNFPAGFSLHHGHVTWGGHVIARGF